jgi:hypothetical protein
LFITTTYRISNFDEISAGKSEGETENRPHRLDPAGNFQQISLWCAIQHYMPRLLSKTTAWPIWRRRHATAAQFDLWANQLKFSRQIGKTASHATEKTSINFRKSPFLHVKGVFRLYFRIAPKALRRKNGRSFTKEKNGTEKFYS